MKRIVMIMTEETARVTLSCIRKGSYEFPNARMRNIAAQTGEALAYCLLGDGEKKPEQRTNEPLPECRIEETE